MMPLLDKLLPSRKSLKSDVEDNAVKFVGITDEDRKSALCNGAAQVRILLFRECEWRGRKLLFDSVTLEKRQHRKDILDLNSVKNGATSKYETTNSLTGSREEERCKTAEDDITFLSEMVFGTVAMTYRGPSLKVHSTNSPPCIMCTKVFPATEHSTCRQSERFSDEALGRSINVDSNSSIPTTFSRPSSGNLSGNDVSSGPSKSSTCSSIGSGWDIDVPPPLGSTQSLESNASSGIGSLTSLRRRWVRAISTSLSRSDSDDAFGIQHWTENGYDTRDGHVKRHKTRLGLTMLVQLPHGSESKVGTRLLEHMALLEGMLDRLRYFCIDAGHINCQNNTKGMQLADRVYRASSRFVVSLLRLLVNVNNLRTPLLWHDVLLNSVITVEEKINTLHHGLQQMCQLLDDIDTKSTNFFLSTVVTAVLTYHLGWVYTVLPSKDKQMMEKLGRWYPCNPLWAQLGDLYGAVGNPAKLAHTVITGDSRKSELINSVLSFLSYFIRSGIVEKRREYRSPSQEDVREAINLLEQARIKRPHLFYQIKPINAFNDRDNATSGASRRESRCSPARKTTSTQLRSRDTGNSEEMQRSCPVYPTERPRESSVQTLKRSSTMKSNLDAYMLKSTIPETDTLKSAAPVVNTLKSVAPAINALKSVVSETDIIKPTMPQFNMPKSVTPESNVLKSIIPESDISKPTEPESLKPLVPEIDLKLPTKDQFCNFDDIEKSVCFEDIEKNCASSKVKIIVSETTTDFNVRKNQAPQHLPLRNIEKKLDSEEAHEIFSSATMKEDTERFGEETNFLKSYMDGSSFQGVDGRLAEGNKGTQVFFTLGDEDKSMKSLPRPRLGYNCQCAYTFMRVPNTSAQLPEGVLRKIIQRNFPESSKSMQPPPGASSMGPRSLGFCLRCNGQGYSPLQNYEGTKELLETPTNATEVLRTCGSTVSDRPVRLSRSNSLEALMEANSVVELPMPRSKKSSEKVKPTEDNGFTKTLVQSKLINETSTQEQPGYTWGLVLQGLIKRKKKRKKRKKGEQDESCETEADKEWWYFLREEVAANARFPMIDQPVSEALCILADLDTWHVGILSNNAPLQNPPLPIGMSRLVANMLESFAYVWRKYHSPTHCVEILEGKLREMWLRSEALVEMLMAAEIGDASVANLTNALDVDAADIPLLLAVATTHSPEIAQRFGLTLA